MMTRLGVYAAVSTALAGGVVVSAFHQRVNFYSACVYLSQSNLCLMILINLLLFIYGTLMYGLQRLCYGPLRPIETEQLYEKAWFAVTETCLAMTIFREEVGPWFLVMFVALITGKVWGWIGDGRVEILEQQPPANPRLFHIRLSISLAMSVIYDVWLMSYIISAVIQQARPTMMVMFLFEFAVLTTSSFATTCRYGLSLIEAKIVKQQTQERLIERRREVREEREEILRQRAAAAAGAEGSDGPSDVQSDVPLPSEDDVDEMDIEVPGWEAKGHWVLSLDLMTDFVKLGIYTTFFFILLIFYGLPIHIMRDLFMTGRSFTKRLVAFLKYKRATRDMNAKYPDATVEDIQREDTCIICREEMRPWSVTNPPVPPAVQGALPPPRPTATVNERSRPKKLPCGHILHLGCLKSWLERQQACPTCRRPVIETLTPARPGTVNNGNPAAPAAGAGPDQAGGAGAPAGPAGIRMLNLGPLRLGFGRGNMQEIARGLGDQPGQANLAGLANGAGAVRPRVYGLELGFPRRHQPLPQGQAQAQEQLNTTATASLQDQIQQMEHTIMAEIRDLQVTQSELQLVQLLQAELARLRLVQNGAPDPLAANFQMPQMPQLGPMGLRNQSPFRTAVPPMQRHQARPNTAAIPSGSAELPPGITIPEGWTLLPLQRLDGPEVAQAGSVPFAGHSSNAGTYPAQPQTTVSPTGTSNNNLTATPTQNLRSHSQASSVHSSDTNAIHTPPSIAADQSHSATSDATLQNAVSRSSALESSTPEADPTALPDWGASQLFRTHFAQALANRDSTAASAVTQPPNLNLAQDQQSSVSQSNTRSESALAGSSDQDTEDSSHNNTETQDKGKGKSVSVEDVEDEEA